MNTNPTDNNGISPWIGTGDEDPPPEGARALPTTDRDRLSEVAAAINEAIYALGTTIAAAIRTDDNQLYYRAADQRARGSLHLAAAIQHLIHNPPTDDTPTPTAPYISPTYAAWSAKHVSPYTHDGEPSEPSSDPERMAALAREALHESIRRHPAGNGRTIAP